MHCVSYNGHAPCFAGFTSKEAYQMGIPAIGIVAVLVANVTFITW